MSVSGIDAAPVLAGLAVVIVAAALGVVASGGWLRQLVGLLIAAVAGFAALRALTLNAGGAALRRALQDSPAYIGGGGTHAPVDGAAWPWLAAVAFAIASVLGVVVAMRARAWPRMSARYEREVPARTEPVEDDLWRAQDQGQDPTVGDAPR